jgi:hypothetical protein
MDKKPNVFPSKENKIDTNFISEEEKKIKFEDEKKIVVNEIYTNSIVSSGQLDALAVMRQRTEEQLRLKKQFGEVKDAKLSETSEKPVKQINNTIDEKEKTKYKMEENTNYQTIGQITKTDYGKTPNNLNPYIIELSQPNFNAPFDVIELPSQGKLYKSKKSTVKLSFMTTADENILTSPNLLQSGNFLEIFINRKLLDTDLRYKDLTVGDRNAIMIWLRATGYGEIYPVTLYENDMDEKGFEAEINLNSLKVKNLGAEPDSEGFFDFTFPLTKIPIKTKFLTLGEIDEIDRIITEEKEKNVPVNNTTTYTLEKMIVEVNGSRDKNIIRDFSKNIRIGDAKALTEYMEKIESGIDLNIEVRTPGGESIKTFLPLNFSFFWPNFKL